MFSAPGMINRIDVSNQGGVEDGYIVTDQAVEELTVALPDGDTYSFDEVKKDGIESAQTASDQVSQIFIVMSSFAIIAGVALIINIFVMLAEERKPEMGISRAIGMQRGHLTQTFMLEGVVYALLASVIGAFAGLLIAAVMMALFSSIVAGQGLDVHIQLPVGQPVDSGVRWVPDNRAHGRGRIVAREQAQHSAGDQGHPGTDLAKSEEQVPADRSAGDVHSGCS